jgi:pentatricopeptide repeat protein
MASLDVMSNPAGGSAALLLLQGAGQAVIQAISHVQVELSVFLLAIGIHMAFFGKYPVARIGQKRGKAAGETLKEGVPPLAAAGTAAKAAGAAMDETQEGSSRQRVAKKQAAVLDSFRAGRRVEEAVKAFKEFPEKTPSLYNKLLDVCVDCKAFDAAEEVMTEATSAGMEDVVTYNTMIKAYVQRGQLPRAHAAVTEMRKHGLEPNSVTFNELLDATVGTDPDAAWALLSEMKAFGVKPNPITTSILLKSIQATSNAAEVERAMAVMNTMDDQIDEVLLSSVIEACVRAGRGDLLRHQLQRQRTSKRVQVKGAHTYGSIIRAYGAVGDLPGAWDAWQQMKAKNILPTSVTLGCMVEALVSNGSPEVAHGLIREALSNPATRSLVNAVIYCSVLKGLSHQKKIDRVWEIYQELLQEQLPLTVATFNAMVDSCARCGEMARAPGLLDEMVRQGIQPNLITYSSVLKGYCQENKLDKALELLEHMKQAGFMPDEVTYNTLLDGCARQGLYDRGMLVLEEMETAGVKPTNFTLSVLVKLANRGKRLQKCFALVEELPKKYRFRPNVHVYNNLIQACVQHKDVQRGLGILVEMLSKKPLVSPDARTYALLLRGCVNAGLAKECADLLRLALGVPVAQPKTSLAARVPGGAWAMQLPKGTKLGDDVVNEVVEALARQCRQEQCAVDLLNDLRHFPGLRLDPKICARLSARTSGGR